MIICTKDKSKAYRLFFPRGTVSATIHTPALEPIGDVSRELPRLAQANIAKGLKLRFAEAIFFVSPELQFCVSRLVFRRQRSARDEQSVATLLLCTLGGRPRWAMGGCHLTLQELSVAAELVRTSKQDPSPLGRARVRE